MNLRTLVSIALCGLFTPATPAWPQGALPATPSQPAASQPAVPTGSLTSADLEQLLGPIALYPDDLLANVLAASVYPDEVQEAFNFVKGGGDKKKIDTRDWEPPVKAVAKIPDVVKMMGEFMDWTTALGQAYLTQAQGVMTAVQSLRKKAQANGVLQTTEQQKVVVEQETIYIQSSDPEVVYVPSYQPSVVYVEDDDSDVWAAGIIGFGAGVIVGAAWGDLDCDWHHGCVGWGDADVDIDVGDINIGNQVGSGNRVDHRGRVGQEGGAWSPNQGKQLATSKPSQTQNFRGGGAGGAPRAATPRTSSASRAPGAAPRATSQPGGRTPAPSSPTSRTQAPSAARQPSASRSMPAVPSTDRAQSAFRGGSDTRASSSRGSSSRQSAQRSSSGGSRSAPSRSSGGSRGGGGRGGGRR